MNRALGGSDLLISTKRIYPVNELLQLMKDNLGNRFGLFEIKKVIKAEVISVQSVGGWAIQIASVNFLGTGKGKIIISQKPIKSKLLFWTFLTVITFGIAFFIKRIAGFFGIEGPKANRALMRELGEAIEKLV